MREMRRYTEQINGKWVITAERDNTITASGDGNKLKSVSGASMDRFAELEDKIESGELVDCKEVVKECLQILYKRIDCGCLTLTPFVRGWNEAISMVFKEISEKYGVSMEDEE